MVLQSPKLTLGAKDLRYLSGDVNPPKTKDMAVVVKKRVITPIGTLLNGTKDSKAQRTKTRGPIPGASILTQTHCRIFRAHSKCTPSLLARSLHERCVGFRAGLAKENRLNPLSLLCVPSGSAPNVIATAHSKLSLDSQ